MKNNKFDNLSLWILAVIPMIITIILYKYMPDKIPMHWNIQGDIDRYDTKFPNVFLLPAIILLILGLMTFLPVIDPKRKNYKVFGKAYYIIRLCFVIIFDLLTVMVLLASMGYDFVKVDFITKLIIGIMFIVFGNVFPKLKHNYFVGVRTPWTLANENVWFLTHRRAAIIWFFSGIIMSIGAFIPGTVSAVVYFSTITYAALDPLIYSYIAFRKMDNFKSVN